MTQYLLHKSRIIFHIDMNCFYASVEMAYNPDLKGKPLAIAGNPEKRKGIIVTSSYEARAKGVKTTMPLWEAKKLCPELIVLPPNFDKYRLASKEMFKILAEITPYIEPVSIDEGYMDVTDVCFDGGTITLAEHLQETILNSLDLPSSIGVAPNKFLAKMASDMKKPLGITILRRRDLPKKLWPLPVEKMYGVGQKTADKLNKLDIYTIEDLAKANVYHLKQLFGIQGEKLGNKANGIDLAPVDPDAVNEFKSIGSSQTLEEDTTDIKTIHKLFRWLSENVERRLKRKNAAGKTIQITIRYYDRKTVTRRKKLPTYIHKKDDIFVVALELFDLHWNESPIRLLGIAMQDAEDKNHISKQLDMFTFENEERKNKLKETAHELKEKYGKDIFPDRVKESGSNLQRTSFQKDFLDDFKY